ncbi:MAG: ROK family protein [Bacilli bacterium]|jgi:glucokinase
MKCTIGVDIGGTDVKIGKFYGDQLNKKIIIKTNKENKGSNILQDVFKAIDKIVGLDQLEGVGFAIPGPVVKGHILGSENLGWERFDVESEIRMHFKNIDIYVLNDANAATVGEMAYGGGKKFKNFVFVTLGTGVGGGVFINGRLVEGVSGSAGEIGHLKVNTGNIRRCKCGLYDCLEQYSSATGVVITANELRIGRNTKLNEIDITCERVFDLAKAGDEVALEVVDEMVHKLSLGLSIVASVINPEAFVLGGGVSKSGEFLIEKLRKKFYTYAFYSIENTDFVLAQLGNEAGIYGANYAVRNKII